MATPNKYDVFISYSRKDTIIADKICNALDKAGITYFIDRQGINGGMEFPEILANAILDAKLFLYLASNNSYTSKFTNSEITFAFNEKQKNSILPYIIDGSKMPVQMRFIFSGINWRTIENHPIETTLVNDLLNLLGKECVKKQDETINVLPKVEEIKEQKIHIVAEVEDSEQLSKVLTPFDDINGKWGFEDEEGNVVIPCEWEKTYGFREGLACVQDENGKYGYIDKTGKVVIPCKWEKAVSFSEGLATVLDENDKCGFIDKTGNVVIPCEWEKTYGFREGLACVQDENGKYGYIDKTGKVVIPCKWRFAYGFSKGLAIVVDENGKYGYIDKTGKVVIPCKWEYVLDFKEGLARVVDENGIHYKINKKGEIVSEIKGKKHLG